MSGPFLASFKTRSPCKNTSPKPKISCLAQSVEKIKKWALASMGCSLLKTWFSKLRQKSDFYQAVFAVVP